MSNTRDGFNELRALGRRWKKRTWAVEGCNGVGKHLSQRLFSTGERVHDVSTRRAALVRVFSGGNGRKNDDADAQAIAMVAAHTPDLPEVRADDRAVALRLVSHRRKELIGLRTQTVCRIHRDLEILIPGGAARKLSVAKARELLSTVRPRDEVGKIRRRFIADQIRDLERVDRQIAKLDVELADLVDDTPTALRDIYGVGTITAALILGEVGNVGFRDRNHFASYIGTAPCDRGSAGKAQPSVNPHGNRRLTPSTPSPGRVVGNDSVPSSQAEVIERGGDVDVFVGVDAAGDACEGGHVTFLPDREWVARTAGQGGRVRPSERGPLQSLPHRRQPRHPHCRSSECGIVAGLRSRCAHDSQIGSSFSQIGSSFPPLS